jgi:hypothetical protein
MKDLPTEPGYAESQDFSSDRDYTFSLIMPDDFNMHLAKAADAKIRQFLIAYILYRWLETKQPHEAVVYTERSGRVLGEVKALLERRTGPVRRRHGLW